MSGSKILGIVLAAAALLAAGPEAAAGTELRGDFTQGGLIIGRTAADAEVRFLKRSVRVSKNGVFVIGFGRDFGPEAKLLIDHADGRHEQRLLKIEHRHYKTERIDGLPQKMVSPDAKTLKRIRAEAARIGKVRRLDSAQPWFEGGFIWPLKGRISGVFGSQRILNGKPRRPHYGVDIAAPLGTAVGAPGAGRVALAETDLYFTGGTVMVDHGHGLTSVFSHLHSVAVTVGARVRQGQTIGTLGATGRATGPHLDWRLNWFEQRLDPALLVGPMERNSKK